MLQNGDLYRVFLWREDGKRRRADPIREGKQRILSFFSDRCGDKDAGDATGWLDESGWPYQVLRVGVIGMVSRMKSTRVGRVQRKKSELGMNTGENQFIAQNTNGAANRHTHSRAGGHSGIAAEREKEKRKTGNRTKDCRLLFYALADSVLCAQLPTLKL